MKKKLLLAVLTLTMGVGSTTFTASAEEFKFADEGTTASWEWAKSDIYSAYEKGIIIGKGANTFDAEGEVTRAEAATMLVKWKGIDVDQYGDTCEAFTDVEEGEWYAKYINAAYANGLISGKGNGKFDPEGKLTRGEAAALLVTGDGLLADAPDAGFTDVTDGWYVPYINTAYAHNFMSGMGETCKPLDPVTRAQFVVMIESIWKTAEQALDDCLMYEYNEDGLLLEKKWSHSEEGDYYHRVVYEYNQDGTLKLETSYDAEGIAGRSTAYEYDADGLLVREQNYNSDGMVSSVETYNYDDRGTLLMKKSEWASYSYLTSYDAEGRECKVEALDKDENLKFVREFAYSDDGSQVTVTQTEGGISEICWSAQEEYNDAGQLIQMNYYTADGTLDYFYYYSYDEAGNLVQDACYNKEGRIDALTGFWNTYEYDAAGKIILHKSYEYIMRETEA